MKKHAKKALRHDLELAGKTVPTLAVAVILLVGAGSAALLTSFGTISGTSQVQQAVTLDDRTDNAAVNYGFNGDQTAGETLVETHTLHNNANVSATVDFDSSCSKGENSAATSTSEDIDWSGDCNGIDTQYVEYFDNAGHDFSDYSSPDEDAADGESDGIVVVDDDGTSDYSDIQSAVDGVSQGTTVLVRPGEYSSFDVTTPDLTVVAENSPESGSESRVSGSAVGIDIAASGVTVKGFEVTADASETSNARGILVKAKNVRVESNHIHDVVAEDRPIGVFLFGDHDESTSSNNVDNSVVMNNHIEGVHATELTGSPDSAHGESKTRGVVLDSGIDSGDSANGVKISHNTIKDIGSDTDAAMSNGIEVNGGTAKNFVVTYNQISGVDHNEHTEAFGDGRSYTPRAAGFYVTGYKHGGSSDYGSSHEVSSNNFLLESTAATSEVKHWDNSDAGTLNADNNYWDEDGIQYGVQDVLYDDNSDNSEISVSWKTKSDLILEAESSDKFGVVNEFAVNLKPDSYTLTTDVVPTGDGFEAPPS